MDLAVGQRWHSNKLGYTRVITHLDSLRVRFILLVTGQEERPARFDVLRARFERSLGDQQFRLEKREEAVSK